MNSKIVVLSYRSRSISGHAVERVLTDYAIHPAMCRSYSTAS
jgi:hypothetical protein